MKYKIFPVKDSPRVTRGIFFCLILSKQVLTKGGLLVLYMLYLYSEFKPN
jgi:hypothetical protein